MKAPAELDALLVVLRKHGVASYEEMDEEGTLKLTLTEPPAPPSDASALAGLNPASDTCGCGHPVAEHNETGQCLRGCADDKCTI